MTGEGERLTSGGHARLRIGVDGKCLLPPRAGVARYLGGVLAGCGALDPSDIEIEVLAPKSQRRTLPWVLWDLQRATHRGYGVFHFPFYYSPLRPRCPVTVAIHDVLVLEHPEWFTHGRFNTLRWMIPAGARRAQAVITGSHCVAEAIEATCRVPAERIRIIGYGLDSACFVPPTSSAVQAFRERHALPGPFLLQVGALEPRRGVGLALSCTAELRARFPDLELVLIGPARTRVAELDDPPTWLRRLGFLDEESLSAAYGAAEVVLASSMGEGFDYPVLEALACGAPVVASDIAVHVEHFSGAVELFPSGDAEALAAAVEGVLDDSSRRGRMRAEGPRRAAAFTWEAAARAHIQLWREVAGR